MTQFNTSKIGGNVKNCAFCDNWDGDAHANYIGNNCIEIDTTAAGRCAAKNGQRQTAIDFCSRFEIAPKYLKYIG
jgi:hypothetical protein